MKNEINVLFVMDAERTDVVASYTLPVVPNRGDFVRLSQIGLDDTLGTVTEVNWFLPYDRDGKQLGEEVTVVLQE